MCMLCNIDISMTYNIIESTNCQYLTHIPPNIKIKKLIIAN